MKFKLWDGKDLKGKWTVSKKIDGIRAINTASGIISRKGKPLYNIPPFEGEQAEIYCGTFKGTMHIVRASVNPERQVLPEEIFTLIPLDPRLLIASLIDPEAKSINFLYELVKNAGFEGLVLNQGDVYLKVKPLETYDTVITGIIEGEGRNKDRLGAFMTPMGNVGTGFTDEERIEYFNGIYEGETVEVECMHLTESGKFRHPRFVRIRFDK